MSDKLLIAIIGAATTVAVAGIHEIGETKRNRNNN